MKTDDQSPSVVVAVAAVPVAQAVATFLAATPWLRVFVVPGTAGWLVVAAAASVLIPTLTIRVWRLAPAPSYAASAVGLIIILMAMAGGHPHGIWEGVARGPKHLLTETLPLGGARTGLAAPVLLTWLSGTASTELVTRARRWPCGMGAAGLAVPIASYVVAYSIAASRPGHDALVAPLLLITLAVVALLQQASPRPVLSGTAADAEPGPSTWRPALAGGALAALVAVLLALVVPSLPVPDRQPAALARATPVANPVIIDPVDALAGLRDDDPRAPARTILDVNTDVPSTGYLAVAVLDDYDGGSWSLDSVFRPTGGRIPVAAQVSGVAPLGPSAAARSGLATVRQQDTVVARLPLPLLPALDRPLEVTGAAVSADAVTGMLLSSPGPAGAVSYSVISAAPDATLATVPAADGIGSVAGLTVTGPAGAGARSTSAAASPSAASPSATSPSADGSLSASALLALPGGASNAMPTLLRFLAALTGRRPAPTVAFLQAVMSRLQADERRIDPSLVPQAHSPTSSRSRNPLATPAASPATGPTEVGGTSLSQVINAVTVLRSGTPEQFATAYAMVARYLGVPARLVSGFRLASSSGGELVGPGSYQVTNRQAWTWVEVPVAGLGWVVADPTPDAVAAGTTPPPVAESAVTTVPPPQANAVPSNQITGGHAIAKPARVKVPRSHAGPWWLVALGLTGSAVILALLLGPGVAGARRLVRRRARRGDGGTGPPRLAVGAWLELLDGLQQAGMPPDPAATTAEVATEAGRHFGAEVTGSVQEVGRVADRAVCSVRAGPDREAAEQAWEVQRVLRRTIHRSLDRRQRARSLLAVGSAPRRPELDPADQVAGGRRWLSGRWR